MLFVNGCMRFSSDLVITLPRHGDSNTIDVCGTRTNVLPYSIVAIWVKLPDDVLHSVKRFALQHQDTLWRLAEPDELNVMLFARILSLYSKN